MNPILTPNIKSNIKSNIETNIEPNINPDIKPNNELNIEPYQTNFLYPPRKFYPPKIYIQRPYVSQCAIFQSMIG